MGKEESGGFVETMKRAAISALGVLVGSYLIDGIQYDDSATLLFVVLLLGLFSAILKPLLIFLALPFVLLTFGIGILFINALLYLLVGNLIEGFEVASFGAAFWGALIITFFNLLFSSWVNGPRSRFKVDGRKSARKHRRVKARDDVIDI